MTAQTEHDLKVLYDTGYFQETRRVQIVIEQLEMRLRGFEKAQTAIENESRGFKTEVGTE